MNELIVVAAPCFIAGAGILAYVWWCWSGRNRGWLRSRRWTWLVLGPLPAFGLGISSIGIAVLDGGGSVSRFLFATAVGGNLLGMLIAMIEPSWWGPAWLRELRAAGVDIHADDGSVEEVGEVTPLEEWSATLVGEWDSPGERGQLRLYDDGLIFESDRTYPVSNTQSAKMEAEIPLEEISKVVLVSKFAKRSTGTDEEVVVERETPLLCILNEDNTGPSFDLVFASAAARRIAEVADCKIEEWP